MRFIVNLHSTQIPEESLHSRRILEKEVMIVRIW